MNTTATTTPAPLTREESREIARTVRPGEHAVPHEFDCVCLVTVAVPVRVKAEYGVSVENDPESNCVGASASLNNIVGVKVLDPDGLAGRVESALVQMQMQKRGGRVGLIPLESINDDLDAAIDAHGPDAVRQLAQPSD